MKSKVFRFNWYEILKIAYKWEWYYSIDDIILAINPNVSINQYKSYLLNRKTEFKKYLIKIQTQEKKTDFINKEWTAKLIEYLTLKKSESFKKSIRAESREEIEKKQLKGNKFLDIIREYFANADNYYYLTIEKKIDR